MTRVRGAGAALLIVVLAAVSACSTTGSSGSSVLGTLADPARPAATGSRWPAAPADASTRHGALDDHVVVHAAAPATRGGVGQPGQRHGGRRPARPRVGGGGQGHARVGPADQPGGRRGPGHPGRDKLSWTAQTELGYAKTYIADDLGAQLVRRA